MRERSSQAEVETAYLARSIHETENEWNLKAQYWEKPRLFYRAHVRQRRYTQNDPFATIPSTGTFNWIELGIRQELEKSGAFEIYTQQQNEIWGGNLSYSDHWDPWRWKIELYLHSPWNESFTSQTEHGFYDQLQLSGQRSWKQGTWSTSWLGTLSKYHLEKTEEFNTTEQSLEVSVSRQWFGKQNYGFTYLWERIVVQNSQSPVEVSDRLNHALIARIQQQFAHGWSLGAEGNYQYRSIQKNSVTSIRGEWRYEPYNHLRYWFNYTIKKSVETERDVREAQAQAGIRFNFF